MNKNEFLRTIADKTESTIKDANAFYEALVGFGTFVARHKAASVRPNPQKPGETIKVAACKVPALKFGKSFKDSIN